MRYERPFLEIEFDQQALTAPGCCKYVPVVLRLCGLPEKAILTVTFERTRKKRDETFLDDYDRRPSGYSFRVRRDFPGYAEYATHLLTRGHDDETGTIHIKLESPSYSVLSEATYRFDSRQSCPVAIIQKNSFRGIRLLPALRTTQERDALRGQFPASLHIKEMTPGAHPSGDGTETVVQQQAMF